MNKQQLSNEASQYMDENLSNIKNDPYRLTYHLMPPVGLLNDPNGLIQYKGIYHVFYQWNPFATAHGSKFWGHFTSKDLIYWKAEPPALVPSEWYEKNGCYSGSAIEHDGKLMLFYTGNVISATDQRETFQCLAESTDGIFFEKKGPILALPNGFTAHFRDPKVWKHGEVWYMVIGAQSQEKKGMAVLFYSVNLKDWQYKGPLAGSGLNGLGDFGYMWECPDFFKIDQKYILLVSPQGLASEGYKYQNKYQSGYFVGEWDEETNAFKHDLFIELDRGFDFYAPQTFVDQKGRRIMFAWMGMSNDDEFFHPTIKRGWIHAMTIPRELVLKEKQIYQRPVIELENLRQEETSYKRLKLINEEKTFNGVEGTELELIITFLQLEGLNFEIKIRDTVFLQYDIEKQLFTMQRKGFYNQIIDKRQCKLNQLTELQIFLDTSSIEVFLNGGEEVFTARYYSELEDRRISFAATGEAIFHLKKWSLAIAQQE